MADEKKTALANRVYGTICTVFDQKGWKYKKTEEKLQVSIGFRGEGLSTDFVIFVDVERQLVRLLSPLPFKMSEEKRIDGAIAVCAASDGLADGSFDYNIETGGITFRMTACFRDSEVTEELILYMVLCASGTVENYNTKFLALSKGNMDVKTFIEDLQK